MIAPNRPRGAGCGRALRLDGTHDNLHAHLNGAVVISQGVHGLLILVNADRGDGLHDFYYFLQVSRNREFPS